MMNTPIVINNYSTFHTSIRFFISNLLASLANFVASNKQAPARNLRDDLLTFPYNYN